MTNEVAIVVIGLFCAGGFLTAFKFAAAIADLILDVIFA